MAQTLLNIPTIPYLAAFTGTTDGRKLDATSTTSPALLGDGFYVGDVNHYGVSFGLIADAASGSAVFEIVGWDPRTREALSGGVRHVSTFTVTATARRTARDNASGNYLMIDSSTGDRAFVDLRGAPDPGQLLWYLCPITFTTITTVYLTDLTRVRLV